MHTVRPSRRFARPLRSLALSAGSAGSAGCVGLAALLAVLLAPAPASAQIGDRQLLATGGGDPYVMILLDTSGSMAWATQCTEDDRTEGYCEGGSQAGKACAVGDSGSACVTGNGECLQLCSHDCEGPSCPRPRNGDDPDSKIYQAKDALYTVMKDITSVRWGFASLNEDELAVGAKHWLYEVTEASGVDTIGLPAVGWQEVFGPQTGGSGDTAFDMTCDRNGAGNVNNAALYETGCYMTSQDAPSVSTTDLWSLEKLRRLPKGGLYGNDPISYFMRNGSSGSSPYLRFTYTVQGAALLYNANPTLTVHVEIDECASGSVDGAATGCSSWTPLGTRVVTYSREVYYDDDGDVSTAEVLDPHVGPFLWWEGTTSTDSDYTKDAYFGGRTDGEPELPGIGTYASGIYADKTCRGWEPSNNTWGQRDPVAVPSETDPHTEAAGSYNLRWPTTHNTFPTIPGTFAGYEWLFDFGDVIPLNWDTTDPDNDNLTAVLKRLNPKHPIVDDESFAQAPFFADSYASGEFFLRLQTEDDAGTSGEGLDEAIRPLVAAGSTPLAGWFSMFRNWYSGCGDPGNCADEFVGWADIAAQYDPNFACSKKYVLMITDGAETCDGSPQENAEDYYEDNIEEFPDGFSKTADQCRYRASLSAQEDVETLVIGFGTENKAKLQCANTPVFFANTKGELVTLLIQLLDEIQEQAAAFASAAVPTVQANILDKVYLSSFVPLNDASVWPGRVDAFLKPLPLDADNLPDRSDAKNCGLTGETANCFAWDAGDSQLGWDTDGAPAYEPERLLLQAPLASEISYLVDGTFVDSSLQIGDGEDERRVFFGLPSTSTSISRRMLLDFPSDPDDVDDAGTENVEPEELTNYEYAWNIAPPDLTDHDARRAAVADVIAFTLKEKRATIDFACTAGSSLLLGRSCATDADCGESAAGAGDGDCTIDAKIQYLLGDVFHSNPLVLNPPSDFELFTKDLYWPGDGILSNVAGTGLCGESAATTALRGSQISYAWYSNKNLCRRISLFVGSNDGQLHSFDAGIFDGTNCQLEFAHTAGDLTLGDTPECAEGNVGDPCDSDADCDTDPDLADGVCRRPTVFGDFDYGTGRELFSFIPESMMPVVEELAELGDGDLIGDGELTTQWGPDGTPLSVDVFVDPYVGPGDTPTCEDRVWRTLLLSNYREGGPGLVALDVTQPDTFDEDRNAPEPTPGTLNYVPSCATNLDGSPTAGCDLFCRQESGAEDTDCAKLAYPALRWEFRDLDAGAPADADLNGLADLAETWSRPFIARLSVCDGACDTDAEPEDRFVAIFGGGISESPANDSSDEAGNWLYMVDVETGEPIYKRGGSGAGTSSPIVGSVPSDITGVDFNTDGRVDTLYFGTTAGFVYKVDLGNGPFQLDTDGLITDVDALGDPDTGRYDPFQVFSTGGRPIYLEIGAVFVPKKRANAILFGTGNRSNLWENNGVTGRFYTLLDDDWEDDVAGVHDGVRDGGVLTEANYQSVDPDTGSVADYLYDIDGPGVGVDPGWYFPLGANEKLITEAFTLTGITVFTIYDPLILEDDDVCAFSGDSKIFVVNTVTTEGYQIQAGAGERTRYITAPTFTTQPFVEYSATKNPGAANSGTSADDWTEELGDIYRSLKKLFPSGAKFANYTLDIKTVRSDTGVIFIAPVPIAINPHNWKEF